ncbi:MAG: flagellar assembly protein FliH [Hyphomicrobiaceae bacterium]|nr:flagellar assembly protein FliH [Hyphomicrobiaceae bacterium]
MTSIAPQKFRFDLDFAASGAKRQKVIAEAELDRLLAEAEARGHARGLKEGQTSALAEAARGLEAAATGLVARAGEAVNRSDARLAEITADATNLAVAVARKLAGALIERHPIEEIGTLLRECLLSLDNAPHLVIRCHPDLADEIRTLAENQIATSGFTGRLVIMGEPEIGLADARFEWVDGGLVRDLGQINAEIDARVAAFLGPDAKSLSLNTAVDPEAMSIVAASDDPDDRLLTSENQDG